MRYDEAPDLIGYYLEDSWVLSILLSGDVLVIEAELVLTPQHSAYQPPRPGEQHCYRRGRLVFSRPGPIEFVGGGPFHPAMDASGSLDLGHIDAMTIDGDHYVLEGDWGEVRLGAASLKVELVAE